MDLALWATQDALAALAADALPTVSVCLGAPPNLEPEHVWVSGETPGPVNRVYRQSGVVAADERFDVVMHFLTERRDPDYVVVRDRMKDMVDAFTTALAADPTLGGLLKLCVVVQAQPEEAFKDDSTRQMMTTLTIRCDAHVVATG